MLLLAACAVSSGFAAERDYLPLPTDWGRMYWAEGLPLCVPNARWYRLTETGSYAFVLDTQKMSIPHFGALPPERDVRAWEKLPSAGFVLSVEAGGKSYTCQAGGAWSFENGGPRLISTGRWVQRADVQGLVFKTVSGETLVVDGRLETIAWPDRLGFWLEVKPHGNMGPLKTSIHLNSGGKECRSEAAGGDVWLVLDPVKMKAVDTAARVVVTAEACPVKFEPEKGWFQVNLNDVSPVRAKAPHDGPNDRMERIKLTLENPTDQPQPVRMMFEKTKFLDSFGAPITGVTVMLRHPDGQPSGIPVQVSKDWHSKDSLPYNGVWLNAFTQVRLPPKSRQEFELTLAYGFWGGVAAVSHAQLCLIGWGSNQQWDQSAMGSWGESLCYEPDQQQALASMLDIRPLMVTVINSEHGTWGWTNNVGGADYCRFYAPDGKRVFPSRMRTEYRRTGPCLSEVIYTGETGEGLKQMLSASLVRSNDYVRGLFTIRAYVTKPMPFSRFVVFQAGSDSYGYSVPRRVACGDASGMAEEWTPQRGGNVNRKMIGPRSGKNNWISLHDTEKPDKAGANANRGVIIRSWNASIGGRQVKPYFCERGAMPREHPKDGSTLADVLLPPDVKQLSPGDRIEAQIELVVVPQFARDYYGPDAELKAALEKDENTAKMILREAAACAPDVTVTKGKLLQCFPDVRVQCAEGAAELTVKSGPGFTAVTFAGLKSACGGRLLVDGMEYRADAHGNDFWQTDFDASDGTWSRTYTLPLQKGCKIVYQ